MKPRRVAGTAMERATWSLIVYAVFTFFVLGPLAAVIAISFMPSAYTGFTAVTPSWYAKLFTTPDLYWPLLRSFEVAFVVVAVQLVLGTLMAYATYRRKVWGARFLDAASNITIAIPSVVAGLALLIFYGGIGPVQAVTQLVFGSPFVLLWTFWIVILAHVLETFPYMIRSVSAVLQKLDLDLESAARSLGASRATVFRTIVLPQLRPGLVAGAVLVFARSMAEFGATIIVVSALLRTAPIRIYVEAEAGALEIAAAYSVALMVVSFVTYLVMRRIMLRHEWTVGSV